PSDVASASSVPPVVPALRLFALGRECIAERGASQSGGQRNAVASQAAVLARERACEGNGFLARTLPCWPEGARRSGSSTQAALLQGSARKAPPDGRDVQASFFRNRCATIRLLARACHSATALAFIRPRTGMKPKPWFLRLALIRSISLRRLKTSWPACVAIRQRHSFTPSGSFARRLLRLAGVRGLMSSPSLGGGA